MNKTDIEWCDYTLNPVVGCKHGCSYCYAKKNFENPRFGVKSHKWDDPQFYPKRLKLPNKPPGIVFVGSMCDLFGDWVNPDWIAQTIEVAASTPKHTFMFLTKNPIRYHEFKFPKNCMIGLTMTKLTTTNIINYYVLCGGNCERKFVSIEPIMGDFAAANFPDCELVIVGAMTKPARIKPKREWIESIRHQNIFYKDNIKKYL